MRTLLMGIAGLIFGCGTSSPSCASLPYYPDLRLASWADIRKFSDLIEPNPKRHVYLIVLDNRIVSPKTIDSMFANKKIGKIIQINNIPAPPTDISGGLQTRIILIQSCHLPH